MPAQENNLRQVLPDRRRGFRVSVLAKSACMGELKKRKIAALPIEYLGMVRDQIWHAV